MDSSFLEALLLPWWKVVTYLLTLTVSAIAIKVTINFDLNEWLKQRRTNKLLEEIGNRSLECSHGWTLYPNNAYSQCVGCQAWIATGLLVTARQLGVEGLMILAEYPGVTVTQEEMVVISDYQGKNTPPTEN